MICAAFTAVDAKVLEFTTRVDKKDFSYFEPIEVTSIDIEGRTWWNVNAHRDDGQRYVVQSDELLSAFLELKKQTRSDTIAV